MSDYFCGVHEHRHGRVGDAAECALKQKDAELTELRAVLAAAGIAKVDGVWAETCPRCDGGGEEFSEPGLDPAPYEVCRLCRGARRIPINLAPVAGGETK